uniref:Zn(2)-C6 fungal-type domain-containing protein n=1 Tax=Mycena chlorophos TaxID=658473 RepID=A0ABQ0M6T4_MYCCL|nr:predicted protein [Mycena chlorophos]
MSMMTVNPSDHNEPRRMKVRRPERSCDLCRKRKIRCDGPKNPTATSRCSNCAYFGSECTYLEPARKRGPKSQEVEELKKQNALLEAKLRTLSVCSLCAQPLPKDQLLGEGSSSMFPQSAFADSPPSGSDEPAEEPVEEVTDLTGYELSMQLGKLSLDAKYFGAASNFALASSAIAAKEKATGRPAVNHRRSSIWDVLPWERDAYEIQSNYVYPDPDLISSLLFLYFENIHPTLPVLHRPSFERDVADNLHLRDPQFGAVLLVVLANASRYSNDPRVFADTRSPLSAGWRYVKQLPVVRKWFEPSLHEVQFYLLITFYVIGSSRPQGVWTYLGIGTRFLQQRGEHRHRRDIGTTKELEEWHRTFWTFFCLDKSVCAFIGRPTGLHPEDVDAAPPLEVDDEYWDNDFIQPPDKPALMAFQTYYVQLNQILGNAMRRLYGSKRQKTMQGWDGPDWEQRMISELESTMNQCYDSFPPHLRWDPDVPIASIAFYDQAFVLFCMYHYTRIIIHRPYINKLSPSAAPSLLICTTAAKLILHAFDTWVKNRGPVFPQQTVSPLFVASIVLIIISFSTKNSGPAVDKAKALVGLGMDFLKGCYARRHAEGRLWEILYQLQADDSPFRRPDIDEPHYVDPATRALDPLNLGGCFGSAKPAEVSVAARLLGASSSSSPSSSSSTPPTVTPEWTPENTNLLLNAPFSLNGDKPGVTIEELLAETADLSQLAVFDPSANSAEDQVMLDLSMWNAAPSDISDLNSWGAYLGTSKGQSWGFNF